MFKMLWCYDYKLCFWRCEVALDHGGCSTANFANDLSDVIQLEKFMDKNICSLVRACQYPSSPSGVSSQVSSELQYLQQQQQQQQQQ